MRSNYILLSAYLLCLSLLPSSAVAQTGALTQLAGTDACVSEDGTGDCADGVALEGPAGVAVSPDGRNAYVASFASNAVAVFARGRKSGALAQLSGTDACVSEDGTGGDCADGVGLHRPDSVAVSRDGRNVYVASSGNSGPSAVAVLGRDHKTGALTQLPGSDACVSEDGSDGACADGVGLGAPHDVTVSADGRNVYVASGDAVAVFSRDRRSGALTQLPGTDACVREDGSDGACVDGVGLIGASDVAVSLDGRNVYVGSGGSNAVAVFARDRRTGALTQLPGTDACVGEDGGVGGDCADAVALEDPFDVAVSSDGRNVYVASRGDSSVVVLARNRRTGALTQLPGTDGCITESGGACAEGIALTTTLSVAVSLDGRNVYVGSGGSNAVAVFARNRRTGALTQLPGTDACVSEGGSDGACAEGVVLGSPGSLAVSRDGRNVYVASALSNAVAVFARDRTGHFLAAH